VTLTTSILLLVPALLQSWLAIILWRRGLHRSYRFFFVYTLFAVVAAVAKLAAHGNYRAYFVTYWTGEAIYAVLGLLAIFEVFPFVFKTFTWIWQFWVAVWVMVGLMIVIAILQAIFAPPIQAGPVVATIYSLEIGVRYVQGGAFIAFVLLASFYRMHPRRYALGIIFGFWLVALGDLIPAMLRSEFGTRFKFVFTFMPPVVYVVAVLIWLLTFLKREPLDPFERMRSPLRPEEVIERVRRLTRSIRGQR